MILENGPKTESCDSGIVVLSKHSSEQFMFALLQTFPQPHGCFLVFNLPIYEASAPSALYLPKSYKQGKSPTMTFNILNTDTKTMQESIYSARVVMYIRSHRYKCTKIVTKPLFRKRQWARQSVFPYRKLERTTCLATWAAHAAVKFGHDEQSTNKNKQTVPNEESENVEGLPSKLLFIWPFEKILCISSKSSKSGSFFWVHLLTKQFELHSFRLIRTIRCPITGCRANRLFRPLLWDNCKVCTPRTALATLAHHDFRTWSQNWILWFWNSCAEQALEWTIHVCIASNFPSATWLLPGF